MKEPKQPSVKIQGYLKNQDSGLLRPAELYLYPNGLNIINWSDEYFEATPLSDGLYTVSKNRYYWSLFLCAE